MDVFVSYASEDKEMAQSLADALKRSGFRVSWRPESKTDKGDPLAQQQFGVAEAHAVVLVWSKSASRAGDIETDTRVAMRRKTLIPIRLDKTPLPGNLASISAEDFAKWEGEMSDPALRKLVTKVSRMEDIPSGLQGLSPRTLVMGAAGLGLILTAAQAFARGITTDVDTAGLGFDFVAWFGLLALARIALLTWSDSESGTAPTFIDPNLSVVLMAAFASAVFYAGGLLTFAPNIPMSVIPIHLIWGFQIAISATVFLVMFVTTVRFFLKKRWSSDL